MFYTGESLKCTGCSEVFTLPLEDHCIYTTGDLDLSLPNLWESQAFHRLLRRRAWCIDCDRFRLVERIPTVQEFMNAAAFTRSASDEKPYIDDELLELSLEEQKFLFERLSSRTKPARCLSCGSTKWVPLELEGGKLKPALLHESCNSDLQWSGFIASYIRRAGTMKVRAYSFGGDFLAEGVV
jgi:hypothetical protein